MVRGYIFVTQNPAASQWHKINNTRGVARLVRLAAEPAPMPPTIMNQLFALWNATSLSQQGAILIAGDNAKITQGPFAGAIAKTFEIDPNQRAHPLIGFLGQTSNPTPDAAGLTSTP